MVDETADEKENKRDDGGGVDETAEQVGAHHQPPAENQDVESDRRDVMHFERNDARGLLVDGAAPGRCQEDGGVEPAGDPREDLALSLHALTSDPRNFVRRCQERLRPKRDGDAPRTGHRAGSVSILEPDDARGAQVQAKAEMRA